MKAHLPSPTRAREMARGRFGFGFRPWSWDPSCARMVGRYVERTVASAFHGSCKTRVRLESAWTAPVDTHPAVCVFCVRVLHGFDGRRTSLRFGRGVGIRLGSRRVEQGMPFTMGSSSFFLLLGRGRRVPSVVSIPNSDGTLAVLQHATRPRPASPTSSSPLGSSIPSHPSRSSPPLLRSSSNRGRWWCGNVVHLHHVLRTLRRLGFARRGDGRGIRPNDDGDDVEAHVDVRVAHRQDQGGAARMARTRSARRSDPRAGIDRGRRARGRARSDDVVVGGSLAAFVPHVAELGGVGAHTTHVDQPEEEEEEEQAHGTSRTREHVVFRGVPAARERAFAVLAANGEIARRMCAIPAWTSARGRRLVGAGPRGLASRRHPQDRARARTRDQPRACNAHVERSAKRNSSGAGGGKRRRSGSEVVRRSKTFGVRMGRPETSHETEDQGER
mmetsp:Transcript_4204/g.26652  ORF Transcript_4204/g.26652 Transcript_4204/m.26652 type:complete len:445 (+) Transcript_4204:1932-3266(+)